MKKIAPSEKMEQDFYAAVSVSGKPLSEAAQLGAQLMIQKALEDEVSNFLGRDW